MDLNNLNLEEFKQLLLDLMQNKDIVLKQIIKSSTKLEYIQKGLDNVINTVETGSEANLRKQLRNEMVSLKEVCASIRPLLLIAIVLVASDDFNTMVAKCGNKLGFGEEFLKILFNQKLKDR